MPKRSESGRGGRYRRDRPRSRSRHANLPNRRTCRGCAGERDGCDILVTDLRLPGIAGLALLDLFRGQAPLPPKAAGRGARRGKGRGEARYARRRGHEQGPDRDGDGRTGWGGLDLSARRRDDAGPPAAVAPFPACRPRLHRRSWPTRGRETYGSWRTSRRAWSSWRNRSPEPVHPCSPELVPCAISIPLVGGAPPG